MHVTATFVMGAEGRRTLKALPLVSKNHLLCEEANMSVESSMHTWISEQTSGAKNCIFMFQKATEVQRYILTLQHFLIFEQLVFTHDMHCT